MLRLLQEAREEGITDIRAYHRVFRVLSAEQGFDAMMMLMRQMREDGLDPNVETYNHVIYGYATSKDVPGALRTHEEMVSAGVEADEKTLSNLIIAHAWSSIEDQTRILNDMKEKGMVPTRGSFYSVVSAKRRAEDWEGIRSTLHQMRKVGRPPNEPTYAIGLQAARKLRDPDLAITLLERRSSSGFPPREDFYVNVMLILAEADRPRDVLAYWRQLVCIQGLDSVVISQATYILTLKSAVKVGAWEEVTTILEMMQVHNVPIDDELYLALMGTRGAVREQEGVENTLRCIEEVEARSGVALSANVHLHLALMCSLAKMHDTALPLFESAMANMQIGKLAKQALVQSLLDSGKFAKTKEVWSDSPKKERVMYNAAMLQLFADAAEQLEDTDWALELHETMLSGYPRPARSFHHTIVKTLAKAGKLQEAVDIAKALRNTDHWRLPYKSYNMLCSCCKERDDKKMVVRVVQIMGNGRPPCFLPSASTLDFIIAAFTELGHAKEMVHMFDLMLSRKFTPDEETYVLLADVAVEAGYGDKAATYVAEAKRRGSQASERAEAFGKKRGRASRPRGPDDHGAVAGGGSESTPPS